MAAMRHLARLSPGVESPRLVLGTNQPHKLVAGLVSKSRGMYNLKQVLKDCYPLGMVGCSPHCMLQLLPHSSASGFLSSVLFLSPLCNPWVFRRLASRCAPLLLRWLFLLTLISQQSNPLSPCLPFSRPRRALGQLLMLSFFPGTLSHLLIFPNRKDEVQRGSVMHSKPHSSLAAWPGLDPMFPNVQTTLLPLKKFMF